MIIFNSEHKEIFEISFDKVEVGTTKVLEFYLKNDSGVEITDIVIQVSHAEVKVLSSPSTLNHNEESKFVLSWTPTLKEKKGLKATVSITATEIYKP